MGSRTQGHPLAACARYLVTENRISDLPVNERLKIQRRTLYGRLLGLLYSLRWPGGFLFLLVSLASFFAIRRISRPLQHLVLAARSVGAGDLSVKIPVEGTDEYAEVTSAFNMMTEKLLEQKTMEDRLRDMERRAILSETAATLAHEIRNPLNLVNLTAGHLARQFVPQAPDQRDAYLTLIENLKAQVKHLNAMVNAFLAAGKPVKLQKREFPATDLPAQIELLVKQELLNKKVSITADVPEGLMIFGDPEQVRLVLLNLTINAINASAANDVITITAREEAGVVSISVSDRGAGVTPDEFEKIFEPYYSKTPGGAGLALTLARRIVEVHGGHIRVTGNDDRGACFTVSLPRKGT